MEYIERIRKKKSDANPFFTLMGIEIDAMEEGSAVLSMAVRPDMLNGEGWLQGGLFTSLADEAMVLAIYPLLRPGDRIASITETTSFLAGVKSGTITAAGRVVKLGRRIAFAEADVRADDSDRTIARCFATYAVLSSGKP